MKGSHGIKKLYGGAGRGYGGAGRNCLSVETRPIDNNRQKLTQFKRENHVEDLHGASCSVCVKFDSIRNRA